MGDSVTVSSSVAQTWQATNSLPARHFDAIFYVLRTGCQWNQLPRQFGDDSSIHRHFQKWCELGILEKLWAVLAEECDELGGVNWEWQAVDGAMGKARFGGISSGRIRQTAPRTA